jgi:hypothetical protein
MNRKTAERQGYIYNSYIRIYVSIHYFFEELTSAAILAITE